MYTYTQKSMCIENKVLRKTATTWTYLTRLVWQRKLTTASSSGSFQMSSGAGLCGDSKNIFLASLYFHKYGIGWVWKAAHSIVLLDFTFSFYNRVKSKSTKTIWYLSVDMQNHILYGTVLLDQGQSSLRPQTRYLVTVVAAQQNAQVNKLVDNFKIRE